LTSRSRFEASFAFAATRVTPSKRSGNGKPASCASSFISSELSLYVL
jgi:hypothetical protein